jgi:hypothetical protein
VRERFAFAVGLGLVGVVVLASGCGYSLRGRGTFLPDYIQTIGIPTFTNRTGFYDLEQKLTERIRTEFIGRGNYRVLPERTGVDALLIGEILHVSLQPATFNEQQQAVNYVVALTTRIEFRDLTTNRILWENPSLVFREEYETASGAGETNLDPTTFFGQETNAFDRMVADVSRSVVSAILEAF